MDQACTNLGPTFSEEMEFVENEALLARVKTLISYNRETGAFAWNNIKPESGAHAVAMKRPDAGSIDRDGYRIICIDGVKFRAHRLAMFYVFGVLAVDPIHSQIDHINGDKLDNRIVNLRFASAKTNRENRSSATARNKLGFLGVYEDRRRKTNKYVAMIRTNKKSKYLGSFATPQEAHKVYMQRKAEIHYGFPNK